MRHSSFTARLYFLLAVFLVLPCMTQSAPRELAPGVFFRQTEGSSNHGWVVFKDYVLVIDANFPDRADEVIAEIRGTTDKPIRFVFDTHHHGDHAYGNNVFAAQGATVVSQKNCLDILRRGQDQYDGWAKDKPEYQKMGLQLPTITFEDALVFDDGEHRVELLFFGAAHTPGDAVAYLPKEKILFAGDVCVNGAFNYFGDADTENWIAVLEDLQGLDVNTVCPGHGAVSDASLLETQKKYFVELRRAVRESVDAGKTPEEITQSVKIPMYEQWTGQPARPNHIQFVYEELTGLRTPREVWVINPKVSASAAKDAAGWTPPKKILLRGMNDKQVEELKRVAPNVEFVNTRTDGDILEQIADADGMMGPIVKEMVEKGKNLRWVHSISAGVEGYMFPEFVQSSIVLTNGQGGYGPAMADQVMGYMLMFSRGLAKQYKNQLNNASWARGDGQDLIELKGKTVLILGLGGIGREVAKRAAGFDMRVLAVDPQPMNKPPYVTRIAQPDEMKDLLPRADFVICCVPLTPQTRRYFDKDCFARMQNTAVFVNVARGEVVKQDDMVEALRSGTIAGAALDVTDPEPLPGDHPLWKMENVLITPHMSGRSSQSYHRRWLLLKENVRRFALGEPLLNVVDKEKGY